MMRYTVILGGQERFPKEMGDSCENPRRGFQAVWAACAGPEAALTSLGLRREASVAGSTGKDEDPYTRGGRF